MAAQHGGSVIGVVRSGFASGTIQWRERMLGGATRDLIMTVTHQTQTS